MKLLCQPALLEGAGDPFATPLVEGEWAGGAEGVCEGPLLDVGVGVCVC